MLRLQQIKLSLDEELTQIPLIIMKRLHIHEDELLAYHIVKESIDARKKADIHFSYCVDCKVKCEEIILNKKIKNVTKAPDVQYHMPHKGVLELNKRVVVVGFGPAGIFSALLLAQRGYYPIIIERGGSVDERVISVDKFWKEGILDTQSNVQFGEGGAGTFSDGKLTTRVKDVRVHKILEEFVRFGAPKEILYQAYPHIGTDLLRDIVKNMRNEIIRLGGEIRFSTCMEDILIEQGKLVGIVANGETIACEQMILAIGHSARDTFSLLMERGLSVHAKAFAVGARVEHSQAFINEAQYKEFANHPRLGAAEYRLVHSASNGRGVFTFCMCPGGSVVPSTSSEGSVVVNGMSTHARDAQNANSAILVQIHPSDFGDDPKKGIAFQEQIERKAFEIAGANYHAPAQLVKDFLAHKPSTKMGSITPSYTLGVTPCDLHDVLPDYVCSAMEEGLKNFDKQINGFASDDAVLTGVETRSSSPIRLDRDRESFVSLNIQGIYPCGEGAGYAGGIVSAAIDGLRCAEKIIEKFHYEKN
ncbi:MAG: hypothetical protein RR537_03750 [Longicatena sp.]